MITVVTEYRVVGDEPHGCAVGFVTFHHAAVGSHLAAAVFDDAALAVAHTLYVEVCRQGVDGFYAYTVQAYRLLECF